MEIWVALITSITSIIVAVIAGRYAEKAARIKEKLNDGSQGGNGYDLNSLSVSKIIIAVIAVSILACVLSCGIGYLGNSFFLMDTSPRTISVESDTLDSAMVGLIMGVFFYILGVFSVRFGMLTKKQKNAPSTNDINVDDD